MEKRQEHYLPKEDDFIGRRKKPKVNTKERREKGWKKQGDGLPPCPVLMAESEPISEPEIKIETPEAKPNPAPEAEKKEVKYKQIGEEWWTKEEKNDYEEFVKKYGIGAQYENKRGEKIGIVGYFPKERIVSINYSGEKGIENREFNLGDFEYLYRKEKFEKVKEGKDFELSRKGAEIIEKEKGKKDEVVDAKPKRKSQEERDPTQKDMNIFEVSSKNNGDRRVYANASIPEDAKEENRKIKIAKKLQKNGNAYSKEIVEKIRRETTEAIVDGINKFLENIKEKLRDNETWNKYKEETRKDMLITEAKDLAHKMLKEAVLGKGMKIKNLELEKSIEEMMKKIKL